MALIKCPNCGGQISDKALQCPHCNCRVKDDAPKVIKSSFVKESDKLWLKLLLNIGGLLTVITVLRWCIVEFCGVNSDIFTTVYWITCFITVYRLPLIGFSLLLTTIQSKIRNIFMCFLTLCTGCCAYISLCYISKPLLYYGILSYESNFVEILQPSEQLVGYIINAYIISMAIVFGICAYGFRKNLIIIPIGLLIVSLVLDFFISSQFIGYVIVGCQMVYGLWLMFINKKAWLKVVQTQ